MNIYLQCCGLVIIALLLFFFLGQKRVGLFSERVFLQTLTVTVICLTFDATSLIAIKYSETLPAFLVQGICKIYLSTLIWVGLQALLYVLNDLKNEKEYINLSIRLRVCSGIASVIVYILPIYIYQDGVVVYTYGPSVLATYFSALSFMVASLVCLFCFRKEISINRQKAAWIWLLLWMSAAIIQFINNRFLLVGFACALGMMALYIKLENPESNIDREYGCFQSNVLRRYLAQCYEREQSESILFISYMKGLGDKNDYSSTTENIKKLIRWFSNYKDVKIFKNNDPELMIVFPNMTDMTQVYQATNDMFWARQVYIEKEDQLIDNENYIETPLIGLIPDIRIVRDTDEFFRLLQYLRIENTKADQSHVFYVNQMILEAMIEHDAMKHKIEQALCDDRVEVFYQPIYSTKKKAFVSAEALIRIREEDGSILPPGRFIPIAEESGLITPLGERVFEKVCQFITSSNIIDLGISYIEVNLSVIQCQDRNLAKRYVDIMKKFHVDPWRINLEITESASVQTKQILLENMKRLIDYGVSFSLDDFGIGQSNLNYVIEMPVSIMKFDMNMTHEFFANLKAQFVMRAVIQMAHEMDLFLVAEGVETEEQLKGMEAEGIDYIQGYYFSKPLPEADFVQFLVDAQAG